MKHIGIVGISKIFGMSEIFEMFGIFETIRIQHAGYPIWWYIH